MIRLAIVEHQIFIRECLIHFIEKNENFEVVLQAESGEELLKKINKVAVDIVLLDMVVPKMNSDETCQKLITRYPYIRIMIYSSFHNLENLSRVMSMGVHGYLPNTTNAYQFNQAIVNLHQHGYYYGDELSGFVKQVIKINNAQEPKEKISPYDLFSERELEIIKCVFLQYSTKEIANLLNISYTTVETHRSRIIKKTNSKNFMGAILFVIKHDLLPFHNLWINLCVIGGMLLE